MSVKSFGVIVCVGSGVMELCRGIELITSLVRHEAGLACCVVVDDAPQARGLSELAVFPASCRAVTIPNPRQRQGGPWRGRVLATLSWEHAGITAGVLAALEWIQANTDATFVVKIDTDALVVAPFSRAIASFLAERPSAGMVGTLGVSCNENVRAIPDDCTEPWLLRAHGMLPVMSEADSAPVDIDGVGRLSPDKRRAFDAIRMHIDDAVRNGYAKDESCEPGVFVVTRLMIDRIADAGYLTDPVKWVELPFPENQVLAMYARAVGLNTYDCSEPGQPFGLQCNGLPFPPEELVARGHSLIHSVKNDTRYSEADIRRFFREHVATGAGE